MKSTPLIAVSLLALGLAGCNNKTDDNAPSGGMSDSSAAYQPGTEPSTGPATVAAGGGPVSSSPAQAFADTAAANDEFEIQSSKLASTKASSPKVKQFAAEMIKAHTSTTEQLTKAASEASPSIRPSPTLTAMQQQTLDSLNGKSGKDFDTAYKDAQVSAHQMALSTMKGYADRGDMPALKAVATKAVPIITAHLNMAKSL